VFSGTLFSILPTPLALVPIYYRPESVVAKLIALLLSNSAQLKIRLPRRSLFTTSKNIGLQLVDRSGICTLRFLFMFGFKQCGRKESPISFLVKDDIRDS
jgi:hypothetical protein